MPALLTLIGEWVCVFAAVSLNHNFEYVQIVLNWSHCKAILSMKVKDGPILAKHRLQAEYENRVFLR